MSPPEILGASAAAGPFFSASEHADSPKPPNAQWRGVMITAPAETVLSPRQPMILIRGTYRISGDNYPAKDTLKLVALDVQTKKEYSGVAGQQDPSRSIPRPLSPPPDPQKLARMVFSGFFNADLVATLKLPPAPATYRVRAELGPIVSNDVTIKVVIR